MTFRGRVLLASSITVTVVAAAVGWTAAVLSRRAFERSDEQQRTALFEQFRREFHRRGAEVAAVVKAIAESNEVVWLAVDVGKQAPEYSEHVAAAGRLAETHSLDYLELLTSEGVIISSAQWPARFGHRQDWLGEESRIRESRAFLARQNLPEAVELGLVAAAPVELEGGTLRLWVVGGKRLDHRFLGSLTLPKDTRAILYQNLGPEFSPQWLIDDHGILVGGEKLSRLIQRVIARRREDSELVAWSANAADAELFQAQPLEGRDASVAGILLVGSSRGESVRLSRYVRWAGLTVGGAGVLLGLGLGWWAALRISRPVQKLVEGAQRVAAGSWDTQVAIESRDEFGALAKAFNSMTRQLIDQRERLVQAERVAAWRELARRLAHELKNPLFPIQITIENLRRAKQVHPEQFEEVFQESTAALLTELGQLKAIIGRFSDFAKMPRPQLERVDLNALATQTLGLCAPRRHTDSGRAVLVETDLDAAPPMVQADPELLGVALRNLVLNALDAMPQGGVLTVRTERREGWAVLEVKDTGVGLTEEERLRLFTPYYTTKRHGTGLGLAIVQSIVSDHKGRITVASRPKCETSFRIELPIDLTPPDFSG